MPNNEDYELRQLGPNIQKILDNVGEGQLDTGEFTNLVDAVNELWRTATYVKIGISVSATGVQTYTVGATIPQRVFNITLSGTYARSDNRLSVTIKRGSTVIAKFENGAVVTGTFTHTAGSGTFSFTDTTTISGSTAGTTSYSITVSDGSQSSSWSGNVIVAYKVYLGYCQSTAVAQLEDLGDRHETNYSTTITHNTMAITQHSGYYMYFVIPSIYKVVKFEFGGFEEDLIEQSAKLTISGTEYTAWRSENTGIQPNNYTLTLGNR